VRTVTHLFNAMRPFVPRDPGIAGAALARDDVVVQLIVDGHHLAPETVRIVWNAAHGRVALVSDSIAAAGIGDGKFRLGPLDVTATDGVARRADGVLAGSTLTLLAAVRNLHALGAPLAQAVSAASALPARIAGRPDLGALRPGAIADVVVLDDQLAIVSVMLAGRPVPHTV
jgi:N-acetylglucosamine-6-phosphate deacetylase